ncbi:hypothetical protein ACHWQZ_G001114 [Mnemiopsis leidyi]
MSDKEKDQFLGFDNTIPCPKNYWKYAKSSSKQQKLILSKGKNPPRAFHQVEKRKKKFQSCNKCENCTRLPCGKCRYCLDKIYHGNRSRRKCVARKCLLKSPKNLPKCIQIKEEETDEYDSSSEEEDNFYGDDILDQMLNKLLHEGAHKEALFKDLLVYKYWKLRPEPSPEELVSLANLLNMTMEGIQQILSNSKSDLLSILPKTSNVGEPKVDSSTARKKIMDILKKYPKDTISDLNKSKKLKLEIKRSAAEKTPLHEDVLLLKKMIGSDVIGYTHHTVGLFVSVPIWLEGLFLFLTKTDHDLSSLCTSRGLRMPKVKKMTHALLAGELPETLVQCLVDHGLNCPKYMNLSFQTLTAWAKHLDKRTEIKRPSTLPSPSSDVPGKTTSGPLSVDVKIKKEPIESSETNTVKVQESLSESTSRTSTSHGDEQDQARTSTQLPCETADMAGSQNIDENKDKSDTESEIVVSEELQSAVRAQDNQSSGEKDEICPPDENVSNLAEKKDEYHSKAKKEPEAIEIADVEMEETEEVKTKEEMETKPAEETERRVRRYKGSVGKRGKAQSKKQVKKEQTFEKLDGGLVSFLWREASLDQVWTEGYFIPTTQYGQSCPELCYLCGSAGLAGFIYCAACAEPFHKYCVDIEDNEVISADWKCERCIMCHMCSKTTEELLLKCCECYKTYHGSCLSRDVSKAPSKNGIWKCPVCLFCRKCGTKGNSETKWLYDFSVCKPCGKLYSKGNYCPLCEAVYEDEDYDTPMVSCMSCEHWVHIECDNITELEYEAMSNLPEDRVVYVCRRCCKDNVWRQEMMQCVQENLAHCLAAMEGVVDQSKIRLQKYTTVRSIRTFENDVFQYIASTPGAVGTFRTVLNECFPWLAKVKKGIFDIKTPVKTPKKIHWFNKTSTQNKVPQKYESSTFVEKDCRTCVLCNQKGDGPEKGSGRLLVCGVDNWIHVNCALWSSEVFEESDGKLMNVEMAVNRGSSLRCDHCRIYNATVGCCDKQCPRSFHFTCGIKSGAVFLSDKRLYCKQHKEKHKKPHWQHMSQHDFTISRRIYIDPSKIGNTKRNSRPVNSSSLIAYVGASRITRLGDVMNISDHPDTLIPIGYTLERLFWSFRDPTYRCRYRCTVVKQIPENPDVFFSDLSDELLALDMPFVNWVERTTGTFKQHGEVQFELTLTIQKPQLNTFDSDSFTGDKARIATPNKVKPVKTPVKLTAKIRQPREEPVMNLDGVKVKKKRGRKARENQEAVLDLPKANKSGDKSRVKRVHKKAELEKMLVVHRVSSANIAARQEQRNSELQRARKAALELQKQRIRQEQMFKSRRYAKLDHTYCMPYKNMEPRKILEYEKHIEPIKVRPGYYIDCISANEGIKSLLQRVGGDDSLRCCGIPYINPKVVFMYEDENGKRCIKMAPPVTRRKSPDHEFEMENPSRGTTKLKSVLYKYNKKKKVPSSAGYLHRKVHRIDMKPAHQVSSLYSSNQFKNRVVQQIKAYHVSSNDPNSQDTTKTPTSLLQQRPTAKLSPSDTYSNVTPTPALQYAANRGAPFNNNVPRHFRIVNSQPSVGFKENSGVPKESPRKVIIPYTSDFPVFAASRTGDSRSRPAHSPHSTVSPTKQFQTRSPESGMRREDASTKFVKGTLSTTPPDTRTHDNRNVQHAMPEGQSSSSSIMITNATPSHPTFSHHNPPLPVRNSSGKVMCVGSRDISPRTSEYSSTIVTGPVISSPINKKPRSGFDVFDFDSERTDDMYRMKCTAEHYTCIKREKKSLKKKTSEVERSTTSSSSLKLSSSSKPSWVVVEENKGRNYEKIDVDSWLTERTQAQKTQKLIEEKYSFDATIENEKLPHRVTEQPGFSYLGGSTRKSTKGSLSVEPEIQSPHGYSKPVQSFPQPVPRVSHSDQQMQRRPSVEFEHQPQRRHSSEMLPVQKKNSRDFLLSEFDAALKKFERTKVPDSLPLKDEGDDAKDKQDPRPMVISPTLLKSNKILEKTVQKAAPTKPLIISRALTSNTKEVKAPLPSSSEKTKAPFPWLGSKEPRSLFPQTKRVKHVDKVSLLGGGGNKPVVSGGQLNRSTPKTSNTTSKVDHSGGNQKSVVVHSGVTEQPGKEVFSPEMVANKKASEGKKTYRMSASLKELQPKVLRNAPPKPPSPVKEVLKDFIKEREIKKTLNFDVAAWKTKVGDATRAPQRSDPQQDNQNKKIIDSFSSYDPPRIPVQKPLSFTESLKSSTVDNYDITQPPSQGEGTSHSLLAELNSTVSPEPVPKSSLSIVQTGYQASPGKVSLEETASILSTSMELCQTYPDPAATRVSLMTSPGLDRVTTSNSGQVSQLNQRHTVTSPGYPQSTTPASASTPGRDPEVKMEAEETMSYRTHLPTVSQSSFLDSHTDIPKKCQNKHSLPANLPLKTEVQSQTESSKQTLTPTVPPRFCVSLPDKNVCSRHYLTEFLNFQFSRLKVKTEGVEQTTNKTVKMEVGEADEKKESPSTCRSKRKSAIIASQNLVEKVYKDEELDDEQVERKNKRKCDRPTIVQSPAKSLSSRHSPVKTPLRVKSVQSSAVKLKLQISQSNNRTYIRCHRKDRDPSEKTFPVFIVSTEDGVYVETDDADDAWTIISTLLQRIRNSKHQSVLHGLAMWTLAHDSVVHIIEQLPNTHRLEEYSFHFPEHGPQRAHMSRILPVPPGGCARTMPVVRKSYIDQFAFLNHPNRNIKPPSIDDGRLAVAMGDSVNLYNRRTTSLGDLPMAMRYRHIMRTVKEVLCVCPSIIHGRGLYCMQDISMGEMIIEYSGTLIRPGLCDIREKYYDSKGIGSYMFRIDRHEVVDATMSGSMARGEELTYDYKFPSEDVKIPCLCGTEKCRKWMN